MYFLCYMRSSVALMARGPGSRLAALGLQCRSVVREPLVGTCPSLSCLTPSSDWENFLNKPGLNLVCSPSDGGLLAVTWAVRCGHGADPAPSSLSPPVQLFPPSAGQCLPPNPAWPLFSLVLPSPSCPAAHGADLVAVCVPSLPRGQHETAVSSPPLPCTGLSSVKPQQTFQGPSRASCGAAPGSRGGQEARARSRCAALADRPALGWGARHTPAAAVPLRGGAGKDGVRERGQEVC